MRSLSRSLALPLLMIVAFVCVNFILYEVYLYSGRSTTDNVINGIWDNDSADNDRNNIKVHYLYSVGCSGSSKYQYQLIQALLLDYSWSKQNRGGKLTRIVNGCTDDDSTKRMYMRRTSIRNLEHLDNFSVWFTETNDKMPNGKTYVMFNRPNGLIRYFEKVGTENDVLYVVLDPDFVFLKAIPDEVFAMVKPGQPMAQYYGLSSKWTDWGAHICIKVLNGTEVQCRKIYNNIDSRKSKRLYAGGAPYIMYRNDWLRLLKTWLKVMPMVFDQYYDGIESDMYAYMIASAYLGLEHIIYPDFMKTCMHTFSHPDEYLTKHYFIHYCQRYHVYEIRGDIYEVNSAQEFLKKQELKPKLTNYSYSFSKYWLQARGNQNWFFECDCPLLVLPPKLGKEILAASSTTIQSHYNILHILVPGLNAAILDYKIKYCEPETINRENLLIVHESHRNNGHRLNSILGTTNIQQN